MLLSKLYRNKLITWTRGHCSVFYLTVVVIVVGGDHVDDGVRGNHLVADLTDVAVAEIVSGDLNENSDIVRVCKNAVWVLFVRRLYF